ncbi:fatty acid desaturase family protein [Sinorhizobium meliloti]|uniref:fatty acid desaturase family protein n=1 Tax=Rhizobium meliloti TaxID=382 RepID=UPI000FDB2D51|nr:Omega-3 fatty acid desaturase [Sinorhizobium meliloti]
MENISPLSRNELQKLHECPWWATPLQSSVSIGSYILLISVGFYAESYLIWIVVWTLCGFILACCLGASHDCAHGTFVRNRAANRYCGAAWSALVLFNFTIYKCYHLEHHRKTGIDGDTEPHGEFGTIWNYLANLPTLSFFSSFWMMSIRVFFRRFPHFVRTSADRRAALVDNIFLVAWVAAIAVAVLVWPDIVIKAYLVPLLVYFPMVFLTSLPEHYGCEENGDIFANTRNVISNRVFRFYFWNGNYHADHHLYPRVPSWNLPLLHRLVGNRFRFEERSYVAFHARLIASLSLAGRGQASSILKASDRVKFKNYKGN